MNFSLARFWFQKTEADRCEHQFLRWRPRCWQPLPRPRIAGCRPSSWVTGVGATFRRGRCRDTDGWMTVNVNGFRAHEEDCRVLSVTPASNGIYQAKFKCHGEGETWTKNHRMSLDNKGRLIMK